MPSHTPIILNKNVSLNCCILQCVSKQRRLKMANYSYRSEIMIINVLAVALIINLAQGSQLSTETESPTVPRRCAYKFNTDRALSSSPVMWPDTDTDEGEPEEKGVDNGRPYVQCTKSSNACFSAWTAEQVGNESINVFISQGCWQESGISNACNNSACYAHRKPPNLRNNTKFCCCSGDFCNVDVTDMYKPETDTLVKGPVETPYTGRPGVEPSLVIFIIFIFVLAFIGAMLAAYRFYVGRTKLDKPPPDHLVHLMEGGGAAHESYSVEHLKLANVVGQGRYGSVWKGNVRDQDVAVKIFPSHYRNYFLNERDIYCLPFMENPALLTYFGCDERVNVDGNSEYLLVLTFAPNGCLQDYLRANMVDCATFCKMALGVAKGLAHLHTDVKKGDKSKPCVSHRDLNTRNILVKNDLTCCLCDLGFAMKISGSKYYYNGEEQHAETKSINDVGTLRYMAPEVLEGAVNLRDCESSLKQIDVYALGLVLWELASRCSDFYQGGTQQTPVYSLPFQAEVGHHPTFEQMQVLVSRHKARPLFPDVWKEWTAVKLLKETIEDCWDQDAEARLTALCVEERLQDLPPLWDRKRATMYVSGVSPTVNSTQAPPTSLPRVACVTETNLLIESREDTAESAVKDPQESTVSEGTVETMLTLSPSEPHTETNYKISNHTASGNYRLPTATLQQPYQGRNPCLERNLNTDEASLTGHLIDRSFKHATSHAASHYNAAPPSDGPPPPAHDYIGMNGRPATPIPYVQNVSTVPKQPNVPGNGSSSHRPNGRWRWGVGLRRLFERRRFFGRGDGERDRSDEAKSNLLATTPTEAKTPIVVETQVCIPTKNGKGVVTTVTANGNVNGFPSPPPPSEQRERSVRPLTLPLNRLKPADGQMEMRSSRQSLDEQLFAAGNVTKSTSRLLKDINCRVKTPGDVPPAVRRARGKRTAERLSLYDDRMMSSGEFSDTMTVPAYIDTVQCEGGGKLNGSSLAIAADKDSSSF